MLPCEAAGSAKQNDKISDELTRIIPGAETGAPHGGSEMKEIK